MRQYLYPIKFENDGRAVAVEFDLFLPVEQFSEIQSGDCLTSAFRGLGGCAQLAPPDDNVVRFVLASAELSPLPSGSLSEIKVKISESAEPGLYPVTLAVAFADAVTEKGEKTFLNVNSGRLRVSKTNTDEELRVNMSSRFFRTEEFIDRAPSQPAISARKETNMNLAQLRRNRASLSLNLPNGEPVQIQPWLYKETTGPRQQERAFDDPTRYSFEWHGFADGHMVSMYVIEGKVVGRFQTPSDNILLATAGESGEVELKKFRPDIVRHPVASSRRFTDSLAGSEKGSQVANWIPGCAGMPAASSNKEFIDVLFLFTPEAAIDDELLTLSAFAAVADANRTIENSGIDNAFVRLAGIEPVPNGHGEDAQTGLVDHIDFVAGTQNGAVDTTNVGNPSVTALRDQYNADVVTLLISDAFEIINGTRIELCGVAFTPLVYPPANPLDPGIDPGAPYEPFAYSVVELDCAIGFKDFTHELGHLLGLNHDPRNSDTTRQSAQAPDPACPGSYAHHDGRNANTNFRFRTAVSTYVQGPNTDGPFACLGEDPANCPGVSVFSNPAFEWTGPTGIQLAGTIPGAPRLGVIDGVTGTTADANNWLTFRKMAPIVSRYRTDPSELFRDSFEF